MRCHPGGQLIEIDSSSRRRDDHFFGVVYVIG